MEYLAGPIVVRALASCANLGPGFDSLGLALSLADEVIAEIIPNGLEIEIVGEGESSLARDERNLIVRTMRATFEELGVAPGGLRLRCRNAIPHARGLGSSAAAIVTGVLAARSLVVDADLDDAAALDLAARLDGHPDNVAACLLGGLTIAWQKAGIAAAVSCAVVQELSALVYVPELSSSTQQARAALPDSVLHRDAASNAGRAALLVHALAYEPGLLYPATRDWLHQDVRAAVMPDSAELIVRLRSVGVPATLSGAGPTVLALLPADAPIPLTLPGFTAHRWAIAPQVATVTPALAVARPR